MSRRDWVYSLSLLVPFVFYDLALKFASVASVPGLSLSFNLVRSDVFFALGYALLWVGLFVGTRSRSRARRVVVVLFHVMTALVVLVDTSAYQYFRETGTALDYGIVALWLPQLREVAPVVANGANPWTWTLLFAALFYAALGPLLVTCAVERVARWRRGPERSQTTRPEGSLLGSLGLLLIASALGFLSLLIGARPTDFTSGASVSFVRAPFVNLVLTGAREASAGEGDYSSAGTATEHPAANASLVETPETEKRNVVLIHLESTRQRAITPYNEELKTTPFLDELAKQSLVAENDYTVVPHTSKASVSVNCGIDPHLVQPTTEANPGGIPAPCLAGLLKDQGYNTALFQSSTEDFEGFEGLAKNFGYEDYYPLETMNVEGFQKTNYFGYEDDIMLKPSQQWLQGHKDGPFMAEYLLGTGHHDYQCLGTSHGSEEFTGNDPVNRYLNCMRLQDIFVENLIEQYKELGLYDNTIFVIYGDHGEAFGEHGLYVHDDTIYQEGIKVPLIIHAPGLLDGGEHYTGLSNHTDILPTVLDLLGYKVEGGEYPGYSLLRPPPKDRTLFFSCFHEEQCLASIEGSEKYIYHYDKRPDELFDLSEDPLEKSNLADERPEEVAKRRADLLQWRSGVNAAYRPAQ